MMYRALAIIAWSAVICVCASAYADSRTLSGYYKFCKSNPPPPLCFEDEAVIEASPPVLFTEELWGMLVAVNKKWNTTIRQVEDACDGSDEYDACDRWTYPTLSGDCEDIAIAKRTELIASGLTPSQVLYTAVKNKGEGHMVLVVRTTSGNFVLDNMVDRVGGWKHTTYTLTKHQRIDRPSLWTSHNF